MEMVPSSSTVEPLRKRASRVVPNRLEWGQRSLVCTGREDGRGKKELGSNRHYAVGLLYELNYFILSVKVFQRLRRLKEIMWMACLNIW